MPITLNGDTGIQTPMYNGTITANAVTPSVNMKNRIINGAMVIDQRNAGASLSIPDATVTYTLDRWNAYESTAGTITVQQSSTAPAGFVNSLLATVTSASTATASQLCRLQQRIEGYNIADLNYGTANAKTITVSFWVRSSLTGTYCASIRNSNATRSYVATYTISVANTWEYKTITIAGDTTGTWLTTNGTGFYLDWDLGSGSDANTTAGSWVAADKENTSAQANWIGTASATFFLTGVQLEVGSTATSFDYRPYTTELQLAQRYFEKIGGSQSSDLYIDTYGVSGGACMYCVQYKVTKRANPTGTVVGTFTKSGNVGSLYFGNTGVNTCSLQGDVGSTARAYFYNSDTSAYITISSEL